MASHINEVFENQTVDLDGNEFKSCRFVNCKLVFSGGEPPVMINNTIDACSWGFDGAAANTIQFMRGLYSGGGQRLIEDTFERIRGDKPGFSIPR